MKKTFPTDQFLNRMLGGGILLGISWGIIYSLILFFKNYPFVIAYAIPLGLMLGLFFSFILTSIFLFIMLINKGEEYSSNTIYIADFIMTLFTIPIGFFIFFFFSPSHEYLILNYIVVILGGHFLMLFSLYTKQGM